MIVLSRKRRYYVPLSLGEEARCRSQRMVRPPVPRDILAMLVADELTVSVVVQKLCSSNTPSSAIIILIDSF